MERMLLPIGDVVLDPRMQAAPGRVVKTYWNVVAMLWHEARRSGKAVLPRALVKDCAELIERGLVLEDEGGAYIPWVSDAWDRVVSISNSRKEAAAKSVAQRRKAAEFLESAPTSAQQPLSKRPTTKGIEGSKEKNSPLRGEGECEGEVAPLARRSRPRPLRRVPGEWAPGEEHRRIAAEEGVELARALAKFRDHEFRTPRSDWDATFRNWLREEKQRGARASPPRQPTADERQLENMRKARELLKARGFFDSDDAPPEDDVRALEVVR